MLSAGQRSGEDSQERARPESPGLPLASGTAGKRGHLGPASETGERGRGDSFLSKDALLAGVTLFLGSQKRLLGSRSLPPSPSESGQNPKPETSRRAAFCLPTPSVCGARAGTVAPGSMQPYTKAPL